MLGLKSRLDLWAATGTRWQRRLWCFAVGGLLLTCETFGPSEVAPAVRARADREREQWWLGSHWRADEHGWGRVLGLESGRAAGRRYDVRPLDSGGRRRACLGRGGGRRRLLPHVRRDHDWRC